MKRRWVRIVLGLSFALSLVWLVIEQFYGASPLPLFNFWTIAVMHVIALLSIQGFYEFNLIEKLLWPRGLFLDDDRQKSVSVDKAVMKIEYKVSEELIVHLNPRFNKWDAWNMFLMVGMMFLLIGMLFVPMFTGISVPVIVSNGLSLLSFVVLLYFIRLITLFGLKLSCQTAILEYRCGACLSELQGQLPESDGCVVCPECGGAWKVPETGATDSEA